MLKGKWVGQRPDAARLGELSKKLFGAAGKNPYYRGSKMIKNFGELRGCVTEFTDKEALWIASWVEYLGDAETALRIRQTPSRFKEIIINRYNELKPYAA